MALAVALAGSSPSHATFPFADLVAERNQATDGFGTETFSYGADRINRFNGALGYSVPIGSTYPVGGSFGYGIVLTYSSNIWRFDTSGVQVRAEIDSRADAGVGWSLSFGELIGPSTAENPSPFWLYRSPRGGVARFYQTLNDGDPIVFNTFYTRDGSYLRLSVSGGQAVVAFTGGNEKVFQQQPSGGWRLAEERDLFGNFFAVTYSASERQITDRHGRVQRVVLQTDPADPSRQVIDRIELTAFAGATAVYDLSYTAATVDLPPEDADPSTPSQQTVSLLSSVDFPSGAQIAFDYVSSGAGSVPASGRMAKVTLATGGTLEYAYQVVELPKVPGALHTADAIGVATRTSRQPSSGGSGLGGGGISLPYGVWQFAMTLDRDRDVAGTDKPRELTTEVTYPDGHKRAYKFSAYAGGDNTSDHANPATFFLRDYAFPLSKRVHAANESLFDSELIYAADGTLLRTYRVRYNFLSCNGCWDQQPSINGSRTIWEDGSGVRETNLRWTRQALGKWKTNVSPDNVNGGPKRFVYRTYPTSGPSAATYPWVDLRWTEKTTEEGGESRTIQRCVDAVNGQVLRERTLAAAAPAANDLIRTFSFHPTGERAIARYYGGDVQPVPVSDLCTLTLPTQEQYATRDTYQYGRLATTAWLDANGSVFLETYRATIDLHSGLVQSSEGADGFVITFAYDTSGRQVATTSPAGHSGASTTSHTVVSGAHGGMVTGVVRAADGVTELSKVETELDAFSRVARIRRWSPDGWIAISQSFDAMSRPTVTIHPDGTTARNLGFDALGRVTAVRPPEGAVHDRTYTYVGRSTTETVKIGKSWDEVTNNVVEINRAKTTTIDRFGRVIERQTVDADGEQRTETYDRGLGSHIHNSMVTDGVITDTHSTPKLTDNRGFQVETAAGDPITGYDAFGNRTLVDLGEGPVVQLFDRAGRLVEQREGTSTGPLWTRNVYAPTSVGNDFRGGKLVSSLRINRNIPHIAGDEVHVEDSYAYTGDGGSVESLRTSVTAGPQTILSFETSRDVDATGSVASLTFPDCDPSTNDAFSLCTPRAARVMQTEHSYGRLTRLSATVGGVNEPWIDGIVRDSAGRVTETTLGNGIIATSVPDPSGVGRIAQMTLSHPLNGVFYDSGQAQFDGLGKLVKLGTQRHVSDHAYRLAIQPIPSPGTSTYVSPTVSRDRLGQATGRDYKVPYRFDPASGQQEQVNEIYVYGPGNRLVWNRRFNDYQASTYRSSLDRWFLVDPSGRTMRAPSRSGRTP